MSALDAVLGRFDENAIDTKDGSTMIDDRAKTESQATTVKDDRTPWCDAEYDVERDAFGCGPRWETRWSGLRIFITALSIEASFYVAGIVSPVVAVLESDAVLGDSDPEVFAREFQEAFERADVFTNALLIGEAMQTGLGLLVLGISLAPFVPLPRGWFNDVISIEAENEPTGGMFVRQRRKAQADALEKRRANTGGEIGRAVIGTYLAVALVTWILYAAGLRGGDGDGASSVELIAKSFDAGPEGVARLVVATVVLAPIFEEICFRGYLMPSLTKYVSTPVAVGASAVIFALVHQHGVGDTAQLLVVGLATGLVYARTRNLAASMAVHAAFNATVIALFALWVS